MKLNWKLILVWVGILHSTFCIQQCRGQLSAVVYPGYTFRSGERPTVDTLNLAARPTVAVYGTLGGTNVALAANTVSGAMLMTSVVDDTTVEFFNNGGVTSIRVKASGITATNLATSVAGDGLAGGASTALSVSVDGTRIIITNDVVTLATNIPINFLAATSNTIPYGSYSGYLTNLPPSQFYTNLIGQVTFTTTKALSSVSAGTTINTAHSLGARPVFVRGVILCATADASYAVGDEVDLAFVSRLVVQSFANESRPAAAIAANATNVVCVADAAGSNWYAPDKTSGVPTLLTPGSWTLKIYARP